MQAGAQKMGFYEKKENDDEDPLDDESMDLEKEDKPFKAPINHFSPGVIEILPEGYSFKPFDPGFPNQVHEPYSKYLQHRIAAGFDEIYHAMTGDLANVNLSSMRGAMIEQRNLYKGNQEFFAEHLCRRIFINWLYSSFLSGEIETVRPRELQQFNEPSFQPHRWAMPDPLKDVQTSRLKIEAGLSTVTDELAEQGEDIEETFIKRRKELDLAAKYEIPLATGAGTLAPGTLDAQGDEQTQPAETKTPPPGK
jgi:lambda family phage portal protein